LGAKENTSGGGRRNVYVDESWADSNITFSMCWQRKEEYDIQKILYCSEQINTAAKPKTKNGSFGQRDAGI
jgi:hypothetical protein